MEDIKNEETDERTEEEANRGIGMDDAIAIHALIGKLERMQGFAEIGRGQVYDKCVIKRKAGRDDGTCRTFNEWVKDSIMRYSIPDFLSYDNFIHEFGAQLRADYINLGGELPR